MVNISTKQVTLRVGKQGCADEYIHFRGFVKTLRSYP